MIDSIDVLLYINNEQVDDLTWFTSLPLPIIGDHYEYKSKMYSITRRVFNADDSISLYLFLLEKA